MSDDGESFLNVFVDLIKILRIKGNLKRRETYAILYRSKPAEGSRRHTYFVLRNILVN